MDKKNKIILAGGGSGGHIIPLLILAKEIGNRADLLYVGSSGMEQNLVPKEGLKFKHIFSGKIRRYFNLESFFQNIIDLLKNILGFFQALMIILTFKADIILAKGGFVSLPVILAGAILRKRIYLHESDIVPGLANRIGAKFCKKIFVSFPIENYAFPKDKLIFSGLPIDGNFFTPKNPNDYKIFNFDNQKKTILITGGSQGSSYLNDLISANLEKLLKDYQIIHICGNNHLDRYLEIKKNLPVGSNNYRVYGFLEEMPQAIKIADLVISRSGSNILETFAAGKPSILIPLKTSASNHQFCNAKYASEKGASIMYQEGELTKENFSKKVDDLMADENKLEEMSKTAQMLVNKNSTKIILDEIL